VPNLQVKMHPAGQAEVVANHDAEQPTGDRSG
jgi:hypothetical protein